MPIAGLTDANRLPRLGKIHLGDKVTNNSGVEYPRALDYFNLPPELREVYGDAPTSLKPVYIPVEDEEAYSSTYNRLYNQTFGLVCKGDGKKAERLVDLAELRKTDYPAAATGQTRANDTERREVQCPCPLLDRGECKPIMNLMIVLPDAPGIGVWQIDTSSKNSIRNINSFTRMARAAVGRISGIPLRLSLVSMEVRPRGQTKKPVKVLQLDYAEKVSLSQIREYAASLPPTGYKALPIPDEERPELLTPTGDELKAANDHTDKTDRLRQRPPPDGMTLKQFEMGMDQMGWTWAYVGDAVGIDPKKRFDGGAQKAIEQTIGAPESLLTWQTLWDAVKSHSARTEAPQPLDDAQQS